MSRFRYKECKNLREFNKIIRKYGKYKLPVGYKYRRTKRKKMKSHKFKKEIRLHEWLSVKFIGLDALNSNELIRESQKTFTINDPEHGVRVVQSNLIHVRKNAIEHYGEILTRKGDLAKWKFVGIEITNKDYYYIYEKEDEPNKFFYSSCVGRYDNAFVK